MHPSPIQPQQKDRGNDDTDLTDQLLSIVSERTGYPTELLGLDLNVEADLGIDSIKRVEIVGEFGRRVQHIHGVELHDVMARLSSAKTLRTIVETARSLIAGIPVSSAAALEKSTPDSELRATGASTMTSPALFSRSRMRRFRCAPPQRDPAISS